MKKIVTFLCLLIILAACVKTPTVQNNEVSEAGYQIPDFKAQVTTPGEYSVIGYVSKISECPPCPDGAQCKPCLGNFIVASQTQNEVELHTLSNNDMILFTDDAGDFVVGDQYLFEVELTTQKSTIDTINDVKLLEAKKIQ